MEHPVATANASKAVSSSPASQTSTALSPRGMSSNAVADVMAQSSRNAPGLATDPARAALQSSVRLRSRLLGQYWPVYFVIRCLVSGVISAGVNTGVAFAMYQGQTDIRLWFFPNVIAGDAAVTVFIQSLIGWNLDGALTFGDVQNGILPVLPGVARWMEKYRITRFYLNHSLQQFKGARDFDPAHRHPRTWRLRRLAGNIFRALLIGAILFPPFWGLLYPRPTGPADF
ncbi:hypothetical protein CXG81DRAFT_17674 [Caulochytrium protostelioides]|uniref:Uncharacterized protein n=1 Tax=Caulochytrium protostelioides TaxID=1555241 RepID=A0A4P9XBF1_9FUNG|nr:hypothetical protein CXG81DRAFT_17674 [Caulochytrium protostelioides]|eukprot:RKP02705.1 hypothetical protein CXG81DRAFT_17674 [Caulochytrium protostelioides]